jgi:hypothetical protein
MLKYTVVTTFNANGYANYGQRMIKTFLSSWPTSVELRVYAEKCQVAENQTNLRVYDLELASPDLIKFKQQWGNVPRANGDVSTDPIRSKRKDAGKGFKWDAVRFSHKVYAIFTAAKSCGSDWLLWMDADMVCHSPITVKTLENFCPEDRDLCFLGRKGKYSECGLYALNLGSARTREFLEYFQYCYDNADNGIFLLDEWHDSFVFDHVRSKIKLNELDWSSNLITGEGHPLINSEWGAYLDHLKGARKQLGHSKHKDLLIPRSEVYWQSIQN